MDIDIKEYSYILAVAKHGNISNAAKELFISQPSLSMYIKNLEDRLGIKFFQKSKGKTQLSYIGNRYIEYANTIVSLTNDLLSEIRDFKNTKCGLVSMGITRTRGSMILPMILPIFYSKYPDIEIQITEESSDLLEDMVLSKQLDFIIENSPFRKNQLEYIELASAEIVVAISKSNSICNQAVFKEGEKYLWIDIKKLQGQRFILLKKGLKMRQMTDSLFTKELFTPLVTLETSSFETAYNLALKDLGVTFVPDDFAEMKTNDEISFFSIGLRDNKWDSVIAYNPNINMSTAARALIDATIQYLGAGMGK